MCDGGSRDEKQIQLGHSFLVLRDASLALELVLV